MARVPTVLSDGGIPGNLPQGVGRAVMTPEAAGAGIGEATARLGAATTEAGVTVGRVARQYQAKQDNLEVVNGVGKFDFSRTYAQMQTAAATDAKDFQQNVFNAYDKAVDDYVNGLDTNERVRASVKAQLVSQRPSYGRQAAAFEVGTLDALDKVNSNAALAVQENRVRTDGLRSTYEDAVTKSQAVIDAQPGATAVQKTAQKQTVAQMLGRRRFEGMIAASSDDPLALQGVKDELATPYWQGKLSGQDFDRLNDSIDMKMHSANSAETAGARAALADLKPQNTAGEVIDEVRLQAATTQVAASGRPELMSQMAVINKQQSIYREGRTLPIAEMRSQRDKATKARGIDAMPAPVKDGIAQGVAATNGAINATFLSGLAYVEYGKYLNSGDYGKGTDNGMSDAVGVAQFTSGTMLDTVKAHRSDFGAEGMSDAQILAMRKDPVLSMKAAAIHALDNKKILENSLGREALDADLYFAHLLGAGGAVRFLRAADQNKKGLAKDNVAPDQVAANRVFFYDGNRPLTNEQTRAMVTQMTMNNPSRVDFAGVQAWDNIIKRTESGLREDPVTFASTIPRFADPGDISTPEGMQKRGVYAHQVAEFYGIPTNSFKPFTKEEMNGMVTTVRDGTADEALGVLARVQGLGSMAQAGMKQLGEKDSVFGYAAGLATVAGQFPVAADVIRGEKRMKDDKDVVALLGEKENEIVARFQSVVGRSLLGTEFGTTIRKAATAHYVMHNLVNGAAKTGKIDGDLYEQSINAVLGGAAAPDGKAIGTVNGAQIMLPRGITANQFDVALDRMGPEDYTRLSKWGTPPVYADGKAVSPRDIADEGRFEAIGGGEYRIQMGDGQYLMAGTVRGADGTIRAAPYIFVGDPAAISTFAARPHSVTVRPNIPASGRPPVEPARPRVIRNNE